MNASLRTERLRGVAKKSLTRSDTGQSLGLDIRPSLAHNDDTIFPETSTVPRPHRNSTHSHRSHDDGKKLIKTLSWTGNLAASPHIESQGRHCRLSCPANPSHHRPTLPSNNKRRIGDPAKYVAASTIMAMPDRWESYSSSYLYITSIHLQN